MSDRELTPDQVAWLHERAAARRRVWADHARQMTPAEVADMKTATEELDAEIEAELGSRVNR